MSDEELRRWAIEQIIIHHKGLTSDALIGEAERLIAFVKPEPALAADGRGTAPMVG